MWEIQKSLGQTVTHTSMLSCQGRLSPHLCSARSKAAFRSEKGRLQIWNDAQEKHHEDHKNFVDYWVNHKDVVTQFRYWVTESCRQGVWSSAHHARTCLGGQEKFQTRLWSCKELWKVNFDFHSSSKLDIFTPSPSSLKEKSVWTSQFGCRHAETNQITHPSHVVFQASFHFFRLLLPFRHFACNLEHRVKTKPTLPNLGWHQQFAWGFICPKNPKNWGKFQNLAGKFRFHIFRLHEV